MSEQLTALPEVARNINLPCKKCGVDRFFVVLAHTTPTSAKVKCEVCGAKKTFKLETAKPKKAGAKKRVTRTKGPTPEQVWNEMREKIGEDEIQPYTMKGKFAVESAIQHPKFGLGFVRTATIEKIDVTFQEGERALVHNRT